MEEVKAIGRRKAAIARIRMTKGKGNITVNNKPLKDYITVMHIYDAVVDPLKALEIEKDYDITVIVNGGGKKGQGEAIQLGISRALCEVNPDFRIPLKSKGFLTRDPRVVERKKPGKVKARKKTQYSKR